MYDYDDIDRALFSLPLEEAPADLRSAILAVTVEAPLPAATPAPFRTWEVSAMGGIAALAVWLAVGVLTNHEVSASVGTAMRMLAKAFTDPTMLGWLTVGVSTVFWTSFLNLRPQRAGAG